MMHQGLQSILSKDGLAQEADGIYSAPIPSQDSVQHDERELREMVASRRYDDYLAIVAANHSMPVMDHEVDVFLEKMPPGAVILDIGGCWGWHWRRIAQSRPDIGVLIIDFIRSNLTHAFNVLGPLIGTQVALLHADATSLPFSTETNGVFDGVWTVQTFQHIPDFKGAVKEAERVLKPGGYFINYSLHNTPFSRMVYKILGKKYHLEGMLNNAFYLVRANETQAGIIENIFKGIITHRYSECFFHPDLKFTFSGRPGSLLGKFDAGFGKYSAVGRLIARQHSFEIRKK